MKSAEEWFDEYGESHRNPVNKLIHWFCVPIILFCSVGLLWAIPHPYFAGLLPPPLDPFLNWGTLMLLGSLTFYLRISRTIFLGMIVVSGVMLWGTYALSQVEFAPLWLISGVIFAIAWVFQFIGHKIEGKKPSFFKDLQFLLVGPAWLLQFIYRRVGLPI